jgi:general secretion pathway protein K
VFNGSSSVDPLIAAPEVIAALPDKTPSDVLGQRPPSSNDTPMTTAASATTAASPGSGQSNATTAKSAAYRIETTINFNDGRRTASEIVITLGDEAEPYRVLSWQDDVEPRVISRKRTGL